MELIPLKPKVLSVKLLPQAHAQLVESFDLKPKQGCSLGLITCDMDDALYAALDEATKASPVEIIFAKSFYAGANHASGPLSGEAIGIMQGRDDQVIRDGLQACLTTLKEKAWFYKTTGQREIAFFPHVISACGEYLAHEAGLSPGDAMAYLIAPPIESIIALDAALKVAKVKLIKHFKPPTETNYGGGYLSGDLDAVQAAAKAFTQALINISQTACDFSLGNI